ncbi:MAG: endolytic transglycosylase MltG [Burkholderiales bacterium]|nr:endolytic transglycosylase MltG [Burkholderiales bacterium]
MEGRRAVPRGWMRGAGRAALAGAMLVAVALVAGATWLALRTYGATAFAPTPTGSTVSVATGDGIRSVARQLDARGATRWPLALVALARLRGVDARLQPGIYDLRPGTSPDQLLDRIARGDAMRAQITFIEGRTVRELRATVDAAATLKHDTAGLDDAAFAARLGLPDATPEGWFFPDTYVYTAGSSDVALLRTAHREMLRRLERQWSARAPGSPLASPRDALVLASIVEKETGSAADRARVAAVFLNRLSLGMRLQSDPTVIYGLGARFDGNLTRAHLQTDTPWNTYTRAGLPPTPIALPGEASIAAVLQTPVTDALYFVARGDGTSQFSRTLSEHNRAVSRWQRH